jgi:hypothetical protein
MICLILLINILPVYADDGLADSEKPEVKTELSNEMNDSATITQTTLMPYLSTHR